MEEGETRGKEGHGGCEGDTINEHMKEDENMKKASEVHPPNTTMLFFIVHAKDSDGYVPNNQVYTFAMDNTCERAIAQRCMDTFEKEWRKKHPNAILRRMEQHFFSPIRVTLGISVDRTGISQQHAISRRVLEAFESIHEYYDGLPAVSIYSDVDIEELDYEHINLLRRNGRYIHYDDKESHNGVLLKQLTKATVKLKVKDTKIRGIGLFADEHIPSKTVILEYVGDIYKACEVSHGIDNAYIFNAQNGWLIDAKHRGNLTRFVNNICDKRSRFCNVDSIYVEYKGLDEELQGLNRVLYVASRNIQPEEELMVKYNLPNSFTCLCPACIQRKKLLRTGVRKIK